MSLSKPDLAVDFDGTIVDHRYPEIGALKPGVIEALTVLQKHFTIVIFSCRTSPLLASDQAAETQKIVDFLEQNGVPYDWVDGGTSGKIIAYAYVDDRAIRYENNWLDIANQLLMSLPK